MNQHSGPDTADSVCVDISTVPECLNWVEFQRYDPFRNVTLVSIKNALTEEAVNHTVKFCNNSTVTVPVQVLNVL